ncbi:MAG: lipid-A-disaccharide synthase N-terminal domain-containing protein [Phycisphaerales bacterium]|nr:lipid-A-disaccharide synthase N-terminal domain-containing protein [Phycisphaerales bacterium]
MIFDFDSLEETLTNGRIDIEWVFFGLVAQLIILVCLIVHWYASRKHGRVFIPVSAVYMGLIASAMLLVYASVRHDIVYVVGQLLTIMIGLRLLECLRRAETKQTQDGNTSFPKVEPDTAEINLDDYRPKKG